MTPTSLWGSQGWDPVHCGQITQPWPTPFWTSDWTRAWKLLLLSLTPRGSPDPEDFLNHSGNCLSDFRWLILRPLAASSRPALVNRSSISITSTASCLLPSLLGLFGHGTDSSPTRCGQDKTCSSYCWLIYVFAFKTVRSLLHRECIVRWPVVWFHWDTFLDFTNHYLDIIIIAVVKWLTHVWLFATPWAATHQAPLSFTLSQSLLKRMYIESVMPSNHLILCCPLLLPLVFPSIRGFFDSMKEQDIIPFIKYLISFSTVFLILA